jgi:hypothetical protein
MNMIYILAYLSFVWPVSIQGTHPASFNLNKPFMVKAAVDTARIIGLPVARAARDYAQKIQMPDPTLQHLNVFPEPVSWRRLFFREYFR